jgi:hypothetical protein
MLVQAAAQSCDFIVLGCHVVLTLLKLVLLSLSCILKMGDALTEELILPLLSGSTSHQLKYDECLRAFFQTCD